MQADGWDSSSEAQALGAGSAGYAGQAGNLGSMLQGIMSSVHSNAGASPAHLHHIPSSRQTGWQPHQIPQHPNGGHTMAVGQPAEQVGSGLEHRETVLPFWNGIPQQAPQQGLMGQPQYGR